MPVKFILESTFRNVPGGETIKSLILEGDTESVVVQSLLFPDDRGMKCLRKKGQAKARIIGCEFEEGK